jgi:hypothetical protein
MKLMKRWKRAMPISAVGFAAIVMAGCPDEPCGDTSFALRHGEATGPLMRPGNNCLRCHSPGGEAAARPFSFGGTVFPRADSELCAGVEGVTIRVTDVTGKRISVVSNQAGNFWSAEPLTPPLSVEAELEGRVVTMPVTTPTGGCALCHSWPDPVGGAAGRLRAP